MEVVNAESTVDKASTKEVELIWGLNFSHRQYDLAQR